MFTAPVEIGSIPSGGRGWAVAVTDIDGDGDRDVYGMIGDSTLESNPSDVIWLRAGWTFTPTPVPPAGGLADDIVVVRPWRTGEAGLLVLNGYDKCCGAGAHQLGPIALFRWNRLTRSQHAEAIERLRRGHIIQYGTVALRDRGRP